MAKYKKNTLYDRRYNYSMIKYPIIKKLPGIFIAVNAAGCGISLFRHSALGMDPIGVLCSGISNSLGIQYGHASFMYNVSLIIIAAIVAKGNLGLGTVFYAVTCGYFIDFYYRIFGPIIVVGFVIFGRFLVFMAGELLFSAVLATLIYLKLGMSALSAAFWESGP